MTKTPTPAPALTLRAIDAREAATARAATAYRALHLARQMESTVNALGSPFTIAERETIMRFAETVDARYQATEKAVRDAGK